jgi:hypothetical protein
MAQNNKMPTLKTAATNLINTLSASATSPGDVMISIVPFGKDVNVNPSNYNASWLTGWTGSQTQPSAWDAEPLAIASSKPNNWSSYGPGSSCPFPTQQNATRNNPFLGFVCDTDPDNSSPQTTSKIPSSGTYKGYICPGDDSNYFVYYNGCYTSVQNGSSYTHTWVKNDNSTWNGCVTDRTQPYDVQSDAPSGASNFFVEQYDSCPSPITPLSEQWSDLKTQINAMTPAGGTNQAIGLQWGWLSLLQQSPLNAPAEDPKSNYQHIIILLTDGLNTQDRWPANGNGSTQNNCTDSKFGRMGCIDIRQQYLCDNIKAVKDSKGNSVYTIWTVQVNTGTPADATSSTLQYCATDSSTNFILVKSSDQIITAFNAIGANLTKLRLQR